MGDAFGPERRAAVCRELTKTYEEVRRGALEELAAWAEDGVKGEITVVVGGADPQAGPIPEASEVIPEILGRVAEGERLKDVCRDVSGRTGLSAKTLYDAAVAAR
jgi:16S rRNA (cytidine1402-2'-O)-methyltransferase